MDGSEEILSPDKYALEGLTSTLTVISQMREDYGRLLCRVTNNVGRQKDPCSVNLVPAGPPDPPTNCAATPINSDPFLPTLPVTCLEGFDGGLPQVFLLEAWQDGRVLANISSNFPEWVVSGMEEGKVVILNITGHNVCGRSDPVIMKVQTNSAHHRATQDKETEEDVPPIIGASLGVVGVMLVLLLVRAAIVRRSCSYSGRPVAEKKLAPSSGEGLDPDGVQSIKHLDVAPCLQEDHTKEESDPMFTYAEQRFQITVESTSGEVLPCQTQADIFDSHRPHRSYDADRQSLNLSQYQSEDSGVSESESDNERKLPEAVGKSSSIPSPKHESDPSYISLPLSRDVRSQYQGFYARGSGSTDPSTLKGIPTKGSSTKELFGISEGGGPVPRKSSRGMIQTSPTRKSKRGHHAREEATPPVEVICLAATPTGVLKPVTNESQTHAMEKIRLLLPQGESVLQSSDSPNKDPTIILGLDRSDFGVPVALYKADNGALLLTPRTHSNYEGTGEYSPKAPVYSITILPKAAGKKSRSYLKEKDPGQIKEETEKLPINSSKNKDSDTKPVGRRVYIPPTHPDVCRRESSV